MKCRLETKQHDEFNTIRDQLNELQRQGDLLTQELQSQFETIEQEFATTKKHLNKFQGQEGPLWEKQQRVTELQSQLETYEQE